MSDPPLVNFRKDYAQAQLYPLLEGQRRDWGLVDIQAGIFSDSEVGGQARDQQNPWQGSQEKWQQP